MTTTTNIADQAARAEREQRDQQIYNVIRNVQRAQDTFDEAAQSAAPAGTPIGAPIGTDRARQLAARSKQAERRPAITSARVRQLGRLADIIRPRAKSCSEFYGLPRDVADDVRRAIAFIDDLAAWERRHR